LLLQSSFNHMIVNNIQLNKFFAKAQQATQVVELTLN